VDWPGVLEVVLDPDAAGRALRSAVDGPLAHGIWRWGNLLPIAGSECQVSLGEGNTPLVPADRLAASAGFGGPVFVKNETSNPTGSFKDRSAAVIAGMAKMAAAPVLVVVSSGNMGAAVAAYAAASGARACVIASPAANPARLVQILMYGATVIRVKGTSGDRLNLMEAAVRRFGWYNATSPFNPYGPEGTKTTAYELFIQMDRRVPDWVVLPVGFGCNLVGIWRGFRELYHAGLVSRLPRLGAVQPEGSPSFVKALKEGRDEAFPDIQETVAWGISQRVTLNSRLGLRAIRETCGDAVLVSDPEILAAERLLAEREGFFVEPSAAAAVAGLLRLVEQGMIGSGETVVIVVTGSGLKEMDLAQGLTEGIPEPIDPDPALLDDITVTRAGVEQSRGTTRTLTRSGQGPRR
jgi:threonine synthase